jgi:hypothetical protein
VALDGVKEATLGEATAGQPVGLLALLLPAADVDRLQWAVRWKSDPPGHDVAYVMHTLIWDGKAFHVKVTPGTIVAAAASVPKPRPPAEAAPDRAPERAPRPRRAPAAAPPADPYP